MENKLQKTSLGDRLLEARSEGLNKMKESSLRPHGKLWGMDTFSWYQPNVNLLSNTLHSFPFPVVWIGNSVDINNTIEEDPSVCFQLNSVITFDNSRIDVPVEAISKIKNVASVNSLKDAYSVLKSFKNKNTVLLFSASGENWKENKESFEGFLSMFQTN